MLSKKELAQKYGISAGTLNNLLNNRYYELLTPLGYEKQQKLLSPCIVRKFIEIYGEPLSEIDFNQTM
ncbi:MAG: DUF4248 domain-containing protein [Crocinitomicaceae bacterium]|nr:DUF4248 domain-containing protein [Crocinitomicaceae bacterium]